jgi:hypothetical protein
MGSVGTPRGARRRRRGLPQGQAELHGRWRAGLSGWRSTCCVEQRSNRCGGCHDRDRAQAPEAAGAFERINRKRTREQRGPVETRGVRRAGGPGRRGLGRKARGRGPGRGVVRRAGPRAGEETTTVAADADGALGWWAVSCVPVRRAGVSRVSSDIGSGSPALSMMATSGASSRQIGKRIESKARRAGD